jgi:DNA-binding NtrC family response regulator
VNIGGRPVVLVVDDDAGMRLVCRVNLELEGYKVAEAGTPPDAIRLLHEEPVALVLLDGKLIEPGDGEELGRRIAGGWPGLPIVVMSGTTPLTESEPAWARAGLTKPFDLADLIAAVERALAEPSKR